MNAVVSSNELFNVIALDLAEYSTVTAQAEPIAFTWTHVNTAMTTFSLFIDGAIDGPGGLDDIEHTDTAIDSTLVNDRVFKEGGPIYAEDHSRIAVN